MFKDLINKTVVITGGSGFLGSQFVEAFSNSKSNVVILDKKKNKKFSNKKNIIFIKCDITNEKQVKISSNKVLKAFNRIDILINNASNDYIPTKKTKARFKLENLDMKMWQNDIDVGLKGSLIASKIFGYLMTKNKRGGNIINVSSDLGIIAPNQNIYKKLNFVKPVTYSVIKHGIIGLTKYTSTYWAEKKIRCNAIAPGGMFNHQDKKFVSEIKKMIPMNRMGKHNEYNDTILFLASESSSYITGTTVVVDGGRSIW